MSFLELINGLAEAGNPHNIARTWHDYTAEGDDLDVRTARQREALHQGTPVDVIRETNTGIEERAVAAAAVLNRPRD